jgi:hypothetical protein
MVLPIRPTENILLAIGSARTKFVHMITDVRCFIGSLAKDTTMKIKVWKGRQGLSEVLWWGIHYG